MNTYEYHEYANIFPLIEGDEFEELKRDVKKNGCLEPIVLHQGKILDGRNRYRASTAVGITPETKQYQGTDPLGFVISLNLMRRHLNGSQRAASGVEYKKHYATEAKQRRGQRTDIVETFPPSDFGKARDHAGKVLHVSGRYIDEAEKILENHPEAFKEIQAGKKTINEVKTELRNQERSERIAEKRKQLEENPPENPPEEYEILVVDPPWPYGNQDNYDAGGFRGTTTYPEISIEKLKQLQLPSADNAILWLWTTNKFMRHAYELLDAWGFEEKTILTWGKNKMGTGRWLRSKTEHCILAIKGTPQVQLTNQTTLLEAPVSEHSEKPQEFYDMIDELCVGNKIDYFSRQKRDGWYSYGNTKEIGDKK